MNFPDAINKLSFRTKVLAPVIAVMVLIVTVSMWLANELIKGQIRESADQQLHSAEEILKITQNSRVADLLHNFNNAKGEPRFKAVLTPKMLDPKRQLDPDQRKSIQDFLNDLIDENVARVIVLTLRQGTVIGAAQDSQFNLDVFQTNANYAVNLAFGGQASVDTFKNNDQLIDIVAVPIAGGSSNSIVGVISFGVEDTLKQQFANLSQGELALLSGNQVVDTTERDASLVKLLPTEFKSSLENVNKEGIENEETTLGDEQLHFLELAGWLGHSGNPNRLGYLILTSYEKPLQNLSDARQMIFLVSLLAIAFGAAVVWFFVDRITKPLRELRNSAEAVGQGDFSRRVPARGRDEFGELAVVFNQMTENLQQSRAELEKTVETLKNTQEQLIQSEKLSGVGEFVAGVTHELNNPLAAVMGFSEMLKEEDVDVKHRRYLDMIHKSAQRCQKIVQSLLSFARRHQPERKPVSVNDLVETVLEIVQYQLHTSNIEVTTQLDPNLPVVFADAHQIQQVLLNVINNARQAVEEHTPRGSIKLVTEAAEANVRIIIHDNGPGIPEENMRRIFDPFFTTKAVGKGTGLGLSLCYGIIREHGGTITPLNRHGEGATFIIELPIMEISNDPAETSAGAETAAPDLEEGKGRKVLVIDDEEAILQMVREELTRRGYEVETAGNGEAGLRRLKKNHCDVVFCDWKMPGLNGREVYENLQTTKPDLSRRIVFITGDVINDQMREFLEKENRICLAKPFTLAELRNAIKTVLAAA
jgi:signal transduction histidine kinase